MPIQSETAETNNAATAIAVSLQCRRAPSAISLLPLRRIMLRPMHGSQRLTPEIVLRAYAEGVFPMAERRDDPELYWVSPEWRGIIPLDAFHVPKRLARTVRSDRFAVTSDLAFVDVMRACAEPGKGREQSWINAEIIRLYTA